MKRFLIPLVTLLAVFVSGVAWAGSASAHASLVSSSPEDGAVLDAPPTELVFTFSEPLLPDFVRFIATAPDGQTGDLIIAGVDGPAATITWPAGAAAGDWSVSYRVVSQDGHPIEGGITFSYAAPAPTASPTTASPTTAAPSPEPTAEPTTASPTPTPTVSPTVSPAADTGTGAGTSIWVIVSLVAIAIFAIGIIVLVVRRRS